MKVLILFSEKDRSRISKLIKLISGRLENIEFIPFVVSDKWEIRGMDNLWGQITTSSHFLIILSEDNIKKKWFAFAVGYSLGAEKPLFLYPLKPDIRIPEYLEPINKTNDSDKITNYFEKQFVYWAKLKRIEDARNELSSMDIQFTKEGLALCASEGNLKGLSIFLYAEFSSNTKNKKGVTLLCLSIRRGHRMLIPVLLKNGADVNLLSEDTGNSPLMDAASAGNVEIVSGLINSGAEIDTKSKTGQTSLMLAVSIGNPEIADLLIRAGADVTIEDNLGMTAKQYAKLFKRTEIVELINKVIS